ncbi:hypothetical protein Tco_1378971 [Tanacetum coccineum]
MGCLFTAKRIRFGVDMKSKRTLMGGVGGIFKGRDGDDGDGLEDGGWQGLLWRGGYDVDDLDWRGGDGGWGTIWR